MGITSPDQLTEAASGGRFLSGEEKQAMYLAREPFYIVGAEPKVDTRFEKEQTYFYVVRKAADGSREQRILPFTHSPFRQRLAEKIVEDTSQGNQSGPWYLEKFRTNTGNDAWNLATKPPETPATAPAAESAFPQVNVGQNATADAQTQINYDDLPF